MSSSLLLCFFYSRCPKSLTLRRGSEEVGGGMMVVVGDDVCICAKHNRLIGFSGWYIYLLIFLLCVCVWCLFAGADGAQDVVAAVLLLGATAFHCLSHNLGLSLPPQIRILDVDKERYEMSTRMKKSVYVVCTHPLRRSAATR